MPTIKIVQHIPAMAGPVVTTVDVTEGSGIVEQSRLPYLVLDLTDGSQMIVNMEKVSWLIVQR